MKDYIEKQQKLHEDARKLFLADRGEGKLIKKILNKVSKKNKKAGKRLKKAIESTNKQIYLKNDLIQMVMLNQLLLTHLLKVRADSKLDLSSFIMALSYKIKIEDWEEIVTDKVIPILIKNKLI